MTKLLYGNHIAKSTPIRFGCSAVIFDPSKEKILLIRRADNGFWCLPAGGMDPGESVSETCEREVLEETGLVVKVKRIIGIYSTPHRVIEYPNGNRFHMVAIHFEAEIVQGELGLSDETTQFDYFSLPEINQLEIMDHCRERIIDSFAHQEEPFIR